MIGHSTAAAAHPGPRGAACGSEETLDAIRRGEIDAVVVADERGEQHVYTLENADRPYRVLIEQMQEAALTLNAGGIITYCNRRLATMLGMAYET